MKFFNYSNVIVSGSSQSGKSMIVNRIVNNSDSLFFIQPTKFIVIYSAWQQMYDEMEKKLQNITFLENFPSEDDLNKLCAGHNHSILIADDKGVGVSDDRFMGDLFSRFGHHKKITSFLILQSTTMKGKFSQDILRNSHYSIIMRSGGREGQSIRSLGIQINDLKNLQEAYKSATENGVYTYLICNLHPKSNPVFRYYSNIFPEDPFVKVYQSKARQSETIN